MDPTPVQLGKVAEFNLLSGATKVKLSHTRGDSFATVFRMFREVDDCGGYGAQTLTGMTGTAVVRPAVDHPMSYAFTVVVDDAAGSGRVTLSLTDDDTRNMPETGVWELELHETATGTRKTVVCGTWCMQRDSAY